MGDELKVDIQAMRSTAQVIAAETEPLRGQIDHQIGKIDDTCKALPSTVYAMTVGGIIDIKAFLGRSMDIRDRISTILKQTADMVEQTDNQIAGLFK